MTVYKGGGGCTDTEHMQHTQPMPPLHICSLCRLTLCLFCSLCIVKKYFTHTACAVNGSVRKAALSYTKTQANSNTRWQLVSFSSCRLILLSEFYRIVLLFSQRHSQHRPPASLAKTTKVIARVVNDGSWNNFRP